jgi:glycosyltransferase involved in cell wall biosynthesis
MRLAWLGPAPDDGGGVPYVGTLLLDGLLRLGVEIDCFFVSGDTDAPAVLRGHENLSLIREATSWRWNAWYSRTPLVSFVTGQSARALAQARLARAITRLHAKRPYDAVYQFSQPELLALRPARRRLPPFVLHPQTHAAGELRWHRRESALARRCEPWTQHYGARALLRGRARVQRSDMRVARLVVASSERFRGHLVADYDIPRARTTVVPNPIDVSRFSPGGAATNGRPLTILFVSRMSVRKGVEQVVALSHRLHDLAGSVRIVLVGDATLWSDYRCLLDDLDPSTATHRGWCEPDELSRLYRDAALLVQPSRYEPFALTVAEALAAGVPVVASDEVGATEGVDGQCCRTFPAGDLEAFEGSVRAALDSLRSGGRATLSAIARREAERLFSPEVVARRLLAAITEVV